MNIWMMTSLQFPLPADMPTSVPIWAVDHAIGIVIMLWVMMTAMTLVLYVGGVINLYWIIGLTVIVIVEKMRSNRIAFRQIGALFAFNVLQSSFPNIKYNILFGDQLSIRSKI